MLKIESFRIQITFKQLALGTSFFLFSSPTFAYIDPNIGGFLFQMLTPLFAIVMSAWMFAGDKIKEIWLRVRHTFNRKDPNNSDGL